MRVVRLIAAVIGASTVAACGAVVRSAAPTPAQVRTALAGSPAPLARLHAQADRLVATTPAQFRGVLRSLAGYPVIVNQWGSWCEPCRMEFPVLQQAALRLGRTAAVIGLDVSDSRSGAAAFLREFPVTYPSYVDPDAHVAFSLKAGAYYPTTLFFDRTGKLVFTHIGPYATVAQLLSDAAAHGGARPSGG
ncbi:MAG TPA: TlpA disulfide reductase family protein [Solirubrobacteraceae bacterium]|nr:TlpA disulfide reductase family protein [Solirubrobacteraceae bacterium]